MDDITKKSRENDYVYGELMGMQDEEITPLEKKGVISRGLIGPPRSIFFPPEYFGDEDEGFTRILGLE
ncbi:MAG: hypothetical protein JRD68_09900 [Deltaproteobacteria bacterium]|nr:hypothetical protein [Deltaproteobacteria bacterium]